MPTVAHVVTKLVTEKPFLHEALRRGIINHAALAEEFLPEVRTTVGHEVTFSAVNMAIRRLSERLAQREVEHVIFDKDSDITVRSHLVEITLFKSAAVQERIPELYRMIDMGRGDFLTITQGMNEVMLITGARYRERMLALFEQRSVRKVIGGLSSVSVHISEQAAQDSGMFYLVTRSLAWENVNIVDIVSTYTELTFIVMERDTGKTFDLLKELIGKRA